MWRLLFIEGLALLLPFVLTLLIFFYLVQLFSSPFIFLITTLFPNLPFIDMTARVLGLLFTLTFILSFGYLGGQWIFSRILKGVHHLFLKIPVVRKIYHSCYEVVTTLLREENRGFSHVVTFPFGDSGGYAVGFLPRKDNQFEQSTPILLPGTPNPLQGFVLYVENEHLTISELPIEKAMKWNISIGTSHL